MEWDLSTAAAFCAAVIGAAAAGATARAYGRLKRRQQRLQSALRRMKHRQLQSETENDRWNRNIHKRQRRLQGYLRLMDTLINTIPGPVYFKDENGAFRGCNLAFAERIVGLPREAIIGRHPDDLANAAGGDGLAAVRQRERQVLENKKVASFEAQVGCADGNIRAFLFSFAAMAGGRRETEGIVGVMLDVTGKNRAVAARLQKEKLQGVLETAGGVCHDLNQPLQALTGYLELARMEMDGHAMGDSMDKIDRQVARITEITRDLQQITRYRAIEFESGGKIIDLAGGGTPGETDAAETTAPRKRADA